jgi:hypothetical protein
MGFGDLFKLAKLSLEGYVDEKRDSKPFAIFTAQYNPETLTVRHSNHFQEPGVPGGTSNAGQWGFSPPTRISVTLVLDGTYVGSMGIAQFASLSFEYPTVSERIDEFLSICYRLKSSTHEPAHLRLRWGKAIGGASPRRVLQEPAAPPCFDCRLESVDIHYKAFNRDGSPLHAELVATFIESTSEARENLQANRQSPDLTHRRVVKAGDTLPLLCREVYGSPVYYLRVAQVNGPDDFRNLTPGQELFFPPFDTTRRS